MKEDWELIIIFFILGLFLFLFLIFLYEKCKKWDMKEERRRKEEIGFIVETHLKDMKSKKQSGTNQMAFSGLMAHLDFVQRTTYIPQRRRGRRKQEKGRRPKTYHFESIPEEIFDENGEYVDSSFDKKRPFSINADTFYYLEFEGGNENLLISTCTSGGLEEDKSANVVISLESATTNTPLQLNHQDIQMDEDEPPPPSYESCMQKE